MQAQERVLVTTLTKRMAEDLTEFLAENGVRALSARRYRYRGTGRNHSRSAPGQIRCAVVGINLLREGLDLPEVSLVVYSTPTRKAFCDINKFFIIRLFFGG